MNIRMITKRNLKSPGILGMAIIFFSVILWCNNTHACQILGGQGSGIFGKTEELVIPIDIAPGTGESVAALQLDVDFDPNKLVISNVNIGSAAQAAKKRVDYAAIGSEKVRILVYGVAQDQQGAIAQGTIANLVFKFSPRTTAGTTALKLSQTVACDANANLIASSSSDGSVVIEIPGVSPNLSKIKVYPNPLKPSAGHVQMVFMNITANSQIKICKITGEVVKVIKEQTGGMAIWDGKNEKGREVASGIYIYLITNKAGEKKTGKIAVVR